MMRNQCAKALLLMAIPAMTAWGGDITGKIMFDGAAPKPQRLRMDADKVCKAAHKSDVQGEEVVVNTNGTLKNVIVYVKDGLKVKRFSPPAEKVKFDQLGCIYSPHVLAVQAGQEVEIVNSDPTLHNVHSLSKANTSFNVAQPKKGMTLSKKFEKPEFFKVKCEVHTWMSAYMGVFEHPFYAVTGTDGSFSLKKLPAGEYTIEAWHEKYGTQTIKVKVGASDTQSADFTFKGK
jgi:plastocyanin